MTTAAPRAPVIPVPRRPVPGQADPATQQRRRLRWTATMAGVRARASLGAVGSVRRRQSLQVCSAARLLTAVGIRVVVVQPPTPWPRNGAHRLGVGNEAGLLGDLALLTAVPRTTPGWAAVADRVLPVGPAVRAAEPDDAVLCPVTVTYRTDDGPLLPPPRTLDEVVAIRGLVLEVRLLAVGREVPVPRDTAPTGHVRWVPAVALRRVRGSWHRSACGPAPTSADQRPVPTCERSPAAPRPTSQAHRRP